MSVIDTLLAHPVRVPDGKPASPGDRPVLLVACSDPSHSLQLQALAPAHAVVVRAPGPVLAPDGELARGIVAAAILHGCREVLVLAHSGCSLTSTDTGAALASLARAGLARSVVPGDVRGFFNLHASPRQLALDGARTLRAMGSLPPGTLVHALLLEEATGEFCVVERGENVELRASPGGAAPGPSTPFGADLPEGLGVGIEARLANAPGPVDMGPGIELDAPAVGTQLEALPAMAMPAAAPIAPAPSLEEGLAAIAGGRTPIPLGEPAAPSAAPPPPAIPKEGAAATVRKLQPSPRGVGAAPRAFPPELRTNLERVRDFYRGEIEPRQRREIVQALQRAASAGAANPELIRIVLKPLLDLGPKRYKVLDELLAVKQAGLEMERDALQALLRHVLE